MCIRDSLERIRGRRDLTHDHSSGGSRLGAFLIDGDESLVEHLVDGELDFSGDP